LYATAKRYNGFVRVFSKLLPIADVTATITTIEFSQNILTSPIPIRGQWYGKINGIEYHVVAVGGKLYIVDSEHSTVTEIGTLTDAKTNFFQFDDILYIQNGYEYMKFGTQDIEDGEELFNSSDYTDPYPETIVLDPGDYHISIGGGSGGTGGGNGGEIAMLINLAVQSTLKVEHLENAGTMKGDAYQILIDDELIAVAGGGGEVGQYWVENSMGGLVLRQTTYYGGDGGGDVASDGTGYSDTYGRGASYGIGGSKGTGNREDGNDGTDLGIGGSPVTLSPAKSGGGGCGYAGGGSGAIHYRNTSSGMKVDCGGGGGGSSFVASKSWLTLLKNTKGTNAGVGYAKAYKLPVFSNASNVAGYIPTTYKGTKPDGTNGTAYEPINALTGKRKQHFNGDNTATIYKLAEKGNVSVDKVLVGGTEKTVTTHYTVNGTKDEVTFTSGNTPPVGINNVEIYYTHDNNADRAEAVKYTHARIYGGKNDNRVFLYGNGNRIIYSDLANGVPSAEYFPVTNTMDVGSSQYDVTGLTVQYDRMLIHKERGTWWTQYDYDTTLLMANFPVYPLNDNIGSSYKGTAQICENNPFVLQDKQLYEFVASNVRDERNVKYLSERVQSLLDELDFTNVRTLDYERFGEYWIIVDNKAYIYNYRLDVWFYYYFADTITTAIVKEGRVVLGTTGGDLMEMDGALDDNGTLINAFAETGWIDYGYSAMRKFLNFMWVQIFPESDTSAEIYYQVDRGALRLVKEISYKNINFEDVDFADFSFATNYNPKSFRLKPKAKKFVYIKFSFINNKRNRLTLLGLTAPSLLGGQSK
jgi:hypothetical protein